MSIAEMLYMDGIQGNAPLERVASSILASTRDAAAPSCCASHVAIGLSLHRRFVTGPYMRKGCQGQLSWRPDRVGGWAAYMPLTG